MNVEDWQRYLCVSATARMGVEKAAELSKLVARMEAVEKWAHENVEGDGLRAVLWPPKDK